MAGVVDMGAVALGVMPRMVVVAGMLPMRRITLPIMASMVIPIAVTIVTGM